MRSVYLIRKGSIDVAPPLLVAAAMIGCGTSPAPPAPPVTAPGSTFSVKVSAGQQAISGAAITLYVAGTAGDGAGAINLDAAHTISTNSEGQADVPEDYTCPSATASVYLLARGGNPGLASGTSNQALTLAVALGDCGNLSGATGFVANEATTAAAAWALAPFFGTDGQVGASATNAVGLRNAFSVAANLVSTATGVSPGSALPASAVLETAKLNTLADALDSCARSDGGASCGPLFSASATATATPANILDAALAVVRHPANQVDAVYAAASTQTAFQPRLTSAPHDWTLSVTYGNCMSGCGGLSTPGAVSIDSAGAIWVANYFGAAVSKFSPTGVPAAANGFPGAGLLESYGVTVDAQGNAWVSNKQSISAANNQRSGSVSEFSSSGAELSGPGFTGGGIFYPKAVAADTNGTIWVADYGSSSASLLASDGTAISGAGGYGASQLPFTAAVALDANHNAWFAAQGVAVRVSALGVVSRFACCNDPEGIAVDHGGNIWIADYGGYSIVELSSSGNVLQQISTVASASAPLGIATDGAGTVWTANYFGDSLTQLQAPAGTVPASLVTLGLDAPLQEPYGIAIDAGGSVWVSNAGVSTLTQFVGLASPAHTPLLGPPVQP